MQKKYKYIKNKANSLGIKNAFSEPKEQRGGALDFEESTGYAVIMAFIDAIIAFSYHVDKLSVIVLAIFSGAFIAFLVGLLTWGIATLIIHFGSLLYGHYKWPQEYEKESIAYQIKVGEDAERVRKELIIKGNIVTQYKEIEETLRQTKNLLSNLYSYDIIWPKYRNLVAVTMFCEYLDSGRCTELKGTEGAYNMFEQQVTAGIIIAELRNISSQLESIRQTQYLLYEEMKKGNNTANLILKSAGRLEDNSEIIKFNCAIAAQNSEIVAKERAMHSIWLRMQK